MPERGRAGPRPAWGRVTDAPGLMQSCVANAGLEKRRETG